jgi:hypothetical protein
MVPAGFHALGLCVLLSTACSDTPRPVPDIPTPSFRKVTLDDDPGEPIALALLPDGRVLHATRTGTIWLHETGASKRVAATRGARP